MALTYWTLFVGRFTASGKPLVLTDSSPTISIVSLVPTLAGATQTSLISGAAVTLITNSSSLFFFNYTGSTFGNATAPTGYVATMTYAGTQSVDSTVVDCYWTRFAIDSNVGFNLNTPMVIDSLTGNQQVSANINQINGLTIKPNQNNQMLWNL